jgi:thiamine-monophosphate kinase
VHFDRRFADAADLGHKALAVNLSDLAAMGAAPRAALLSLVLPDAWPVSQVDALLDGLLALAGRARIAVVGGNIARSPGPVVVDVTATGTVHRRGLLTRSGAHAGDELYVTGALGGAAAGLNALRVNSSATGRSVDRYRRPEPRLKFGLMLGRNRAARACIDLSDGLADGVRQICEAAGLGAVIDASAVPLEEGAGLHDALAGGEDYELLFAVSPRMRSRLRNVRRLVKDLAVTRIGRLTADRAVLLDRNGSKEELPMGFAHFA